MKKLALFIVIGLILSALPIWAQINLLHEFGVELGDGEYPYGSLILSGSTIYGMTHAGGLSGYGTIFKIETDGTGFTLLHEFTGGSYDGAWPYGSLIISNSNLYGMTSGGGNGFGMVFKIGIDGSDFTILHAFSGGAEDGLSPEGSLIISGSTLYGMTRFGGDSNEGTIFKIETNGDGFALLHEFAGYPDDGRQPIGSLIISGTTLYGMTNYGGIDNFGGTIFKMETNGTGFVELHEFASNYDESENPKGSLIISGATLFGMTNNGGTNRKGTIFKIETNGTGFTLIHQFTGNATDGAYPNGSLFISSSTLYGMTYKGGESDIGAIFKIQTDGNNFSLLHSFTGGTVDGSAPKGDILLSDSIFYGMTEEGGNNNKGVIFSLKLPSSITVDSPNGGENWNSGTIHNIAWSSNGTFANVNIDYSIDNGGSWLPVAANTANDGTYAWTVPAVISSNCLVRVRNAADGSPSDISNRIFSISSSDAETVSTPSQPSGIALGLKSISYSFSTGGSTSNLGHTVQYRFDWDDGTDSGWLAEGTKQASHSWSANDNYHVRVMARCVIDTSVESLWSDTHGLIISDSGPALCDFNGDGQSDIAVWQPSNGYWYVMGQGEYQWGMNGDIPVPADYNADGKAEPAVFRPGDGIWYIYYPEMGIYDAWSWGQAGDIPVPGDYDRDGYSDVAVYRPQDGTWYIRKSSDWVMMSCKWGTGDDIPVPGDYDQDGYADVAVYRPTEGMWYIRKSSDWAMMSSKWGTGDDIPVPGDYDGDGKTDLAVWRPGNGYWYVLGQGEYQWGTLGDIPLCGDYNGDHLADLVIWRPSNGYWYIKDQGAYQWGVSSDIPLD